MIKIKREENKKLAEQLKGKKVQLQVRRTDLSKNQAL